MRLWGNQADQSAEPEGGEPLPPVEPTKGGNPLERAILSAVAASPQMREAIEGLLGLINAYTQQQNAIVLMLQKRGEENAEILRLLRVMSLAQNKGAKIPLEGIVANGEKCPICNSTEACDCFGPKIEGAPDGEA